MAKPTIKPSDDKAYLNGAMMQYWQGKKPIKKSPKPKFGKIMVNIKR